MSSFLSIIRDWSVCHQVIVSKAVYLAINLAEVGQSEWKFEQPFNGCDIVVQMTLTDVCFICTSMVQKGGSTKKVNFLHIVRLCERGIW